MGFYCVIDICLIDSQVMCVQYWPAEVGLTDTYTTLKVELLKEEQLANFFIRTLKIYKVDKIGQVSHSIFFLLQIELIPRILGKSAKI